MANAAVEAIRIAIEGHMKGANEVMVEYLIGAITAVELSDWAADLLLSDNPLSTGKRVIHIAAYKNQCRNLCR